MRATHELIAVFASVLIRSILFVT